MPQFILGELWPSPRTGARPLALLLGPSLLGGQLTTEKLFVLEDGVTAHRFECDVFSAEATQPQQLQIRGVVPEESGLWLDEEGEDPFEFEVDDD